MPLQIPPYLVGHPTTDGDFADQLDRTCTVAELRDAYLLGIDHTIPADAYGFYELDPISEVPTQCTALAPDSFLDQYEQYGRQDDPVLRSARDVAGPVDNTRAASEDEWRNSGAYEVLATAGYEYSLETPLLVGGAMVGTLNFARRADRTPFSQDELARVGWIGRKVSTALYRAARFQVTNERAALLARVLDEWETPLIVTDLDGEELFANHAAERRTRDGVTLGELARPGIARTLDQLRADRTLELASTAETQADRSDATARRLLVRSVRLDRPPEMVLSFLSTEEGSQLRRGPGYAKLSPRERDVADFVAKGLTTRQVARQLLISENTVKQHLKRMFHKLNVHSRAQLVEALWEPTGV